jgi:hypothetical protein
MTTTNPLKYHTVYCLSHVLGMMRLDDDLQSKLADRVYDATSGKSITGWELQDFLTEIAEDYEFRGFTPAILAGCYPNVAQVYQVSVLVQTDA